MSQQQKPSKQQPEEQKQKDKVNMDYEEVDPPETYYDSDIASVNEKDFLSDNQPPKDLAFERKLLHKQKLLHIYKTIIHLGYGVDKPARYDEIKVKWKQLQPTQPKKQIVLTHQKSDEVMQPLQWHTYNIGCQHEQIQRLVTSMRPKQTSMFEVQQLQTSSKNHIKQLKNRNTYLLSVDSWTTVIDIDADRKFLKYIYQKGQGPYRTSLYDEVTFNVTIEAQKNKICQQYKSIKVQKEFVEHLPKVVWKLLSTMKNKQNSTMIITNQLLQQTQTPQSYQLLLQKLKIQLPITQLMWKISIHITDFIKIDDVFLDGRVLKKCIIKGVSTAKPDPSSLIYYALTFLGPNGQVLKEDQCFKSDWWQDTKKLETIGCRKSYLDEGKISKMLKSVINRMKPAQVAQIECRDLSIFQFGTDFEELTALYNQLKLELKRANLLIRLYNFTQGRTCYNMELQQKIAQSKRVKEVAIKHLNDNRIQKAYKKFQTVASFYVEGKINQQGYNQKISALMNSILCLMKQKRYAQIVPLCNEVLQQPKHGRSARDITIHGPQNVKIQNNQDEQQQEKQKVYKYENQQQLEQSKPQEKQSIGIDVNHKIIDKCLYRKALALSQIGQHQEGLKTIALIKQINEDIVILKEQVEKKHQNYVKKSKKLYKNMFGS